MAVVSYNPRFQHEDWIDNVDRVQAGGDNGFNIRFNTIETEFQQLSQVVQKVDGVLSALGQAHARVTIGLTPILLPFGSNLTWSAITWSSSSGGQQLGTFVEKPTAQAQASGVLLLTLPSGVTLVNMRVLGEQIGAGDVRTELFQESRTDFLRRSLVAIVGLGGANTPPTSVQGSETFDDAANLYYLLVEVKNAGGSTVRLRGFQITYQP